MPPFYLLRQISRVSVNVSHKVLAFYCASFINKQIMVKIAVLGAGINGVTCALKIKEKYKSFEVVLISEEFSPNTTGDGSGGLWNPYLCGTNSKHRLAKWGVETYNYIHQLWLEGGHNVTLLPLYVLDRNNQLDRPEWARSVFGYKELDRKQLQYLSQLYSANYVAGYTYSTFVVQPQMIISHLYQSFLKAGGKVLSAKVTSLRDPILEEFDVVVNCTGLDAREIVPDSRVFPIRGQITKVKAPWQNETIVDETTGHYVIPNADTCVLGGTHQEHDYNTKVDPKDAVFIFNGCTNMIPGLKDANVLMIWVGLRPGRDEVRIELEERQGKLYIHNYGHGGSGFTLFWGCASEVLDILQQRLLRINNGMSKSKL